MLLLLLLTNRQPPTKKHYLAHLDIRLLPPHCNKKWEQNKILIRSSVCSGLAGGNRVGCCGAGLPSLYEASNSVSLPGSGRAAGMGMAAAAVLGTRGSRPRSNWNQAGDVSGASDNFGLLYS